METEVTNFDAIKALYETNDDFLEIVEQLKASSSSNLDYVKGDYILYKIVISLKGNNYVYQLALCEKISSGNFTVVD